jgi:hypothetical protein
MKTPEEQVQNQFHQVVVMPSYIELNGMPDFQPEQEAGVPIGVDQGVAAQVCRTPIIAPKCIKNLISILGPKGKINHLPNMFLGMAQDAKENELPTATLAIGLYDDDTSGMLPGQYVAELHLVVHRLPDDKELAENVPVARG